MDNQKIIDFAMRALLYEVSATPKPGLVDRNNNGAHHDMDFYSFIDSSVSLQRYFNSIKACIDEIYAFAERDISAEAVFEKLVPLGVAAEADMKQATHGVNTHKGAIYALGLLSSAAHECHQQFGVLRVEWILNRVRDYVAPSLQACFEAQTTPDSYGIEQYRTLGLLGARGEAYHRYHSATRFGLPHFEAALKNGASMNDAMVDALLHLMTQVEDSNVIGRHDTDMLKRSQIKAQAVIDEGSVFTEMGRLALLAYDAWCIDAYVSHGGCADLLAVTLFLHFVKHF